MVYTKKQQLLDRVIDNYADFKASLRGVSRDTLFKMAGRIAVVTETYEMLTTDYTWDDSDDEIDFYLLFRDPLTIIADAWEKQRTDLMVDFDSALFELSGDDRIISQYPLIEGVSDDICYIGNTEHRLRSYADI